MDNGKAAEMMNAEQRKDQKQRSQLCEIIVSKMVEEAQLGSWVSHRYGTQSSISCLGAYAKSDEDILVLLRNQSILDPDQPVELCGISLDRILGRAVSMEENAEPTSTPIDYAEFARTRPIIVSFPNETVWLARESAISKLGNCFIDVMQREHRDWDEDRVVKLAGQIQSLITANRKTFGFWKEITKHQEDGIVISRHLIDWTIASAIRARAKYMAGFTPMIDQRTPGSLSLSDKFNRAYLRVLAESSKAHLMPHYFYTINLSPNSIGRDQWPKFLQKLVRTTRFEIETGEFDGIYLSIRKLEAISRNPGRVRTAKKLISSLADIAKDFRLPLCWSRAHVAGLVGLDQGVTFSTFQLNLNTDDMFMDGGPSGDDAEQYKFGSALNPWTKEALLKGQVLSSMKGPAMGMPEIGGVSNRPTPAQIASHYQYRIGFSKPYNLRVMAMLSKKWQEQILNNEENPGAAYTKDFGAPWCNWVL